MTDFVTRSGDVPAYTTRSDRLVPGRLLLFLEVQGVRGSSQTGHGKHRPAGDENPPPAQKMVLMHYLSR